jgi:serine/threonine-protein kinase
VDRVGTEGPIPIPPGKYRGPRLSPDGSNVALTVYEGGDGDIHVWDLKRENMNQITFNEAVEVNPIWVQDGQRIVFSSNREGKFSIYSKSADGIGEADLLCPASDEMGINAVSWADNGNTLLIQRVIDFENSDIEILSMEDDGKRTPLLPGENDHRQPQISPHGRWMAYTSFKSGEPEVYVCPFPEMNEHTKISTGGGMNPLWSPDGKELYYYSGDAVMAVEVQTEPAFEAGKPTVLFKWSYFYTEIDNLNPWDINPNDERFLMIKEYESGAKDTPHQINIITNWFEELKE